MIWSMVSVEKVTASSISSGLYFSPSSAISSAFSRPTTTRNRSLSRYARSPVYSQPSRRAFAVASGFLK